MSSPPPDPQALRLSLLLQLERRARSASYEELPFVVVNETAGLVSYRQCVLWLADSDRRLRLEAASGVSSVDPLSPYGQWMARLIKAVRQAMDPLTPGPIPREALAREIEGDWSQWLAPHGLRLPLLGPGNELVGELALFRDHPWQDGEIQLMAFLAEGYASQLLLRILRKSGAKRPWTRRGLKLWLGAALLALMFFPVRHFALAPAEVVAKSPMLIRSPFDGVVDKFHVQPNEMVRQGQALFSLDPEQPRTKLIVARKSLDTAVAELQQTQQLALTDTKAKSKLIVLQGRVEQLSAEANYAKYLLEKMTVTAPGDGLVIMDDPQDWLGRPTSMGQKILTVADPSAVELEIFLPMAESIDLHEGGEAQFYPNINPGAPVSSSLTFLSYRAAMTPEAGMAFRVKANFSPGQTPPRIGYRGVAKLYGDRTILGALLLRKPLALLRQWLN